MTKKTQKPKSKSPTTVRILAPKTFAESLKQSPKLFALLDSGTITEKRAKTLIDRFLKSSDTVRGFCIVLLTGDFKASDNPPKAIIDGLRSGTAPVFEVMAKNVVMAPTMAVTHRRRNDDAMAAHSDQTTARTIKLIHLMNSPAMTVQLKEMELAFKGQPSAYLAFVQKWKYDQDSDQVAAGLKALADAMNPSN